MYLPITSSFFNLHYHISYFHIILPIYVGEKINQLEYYL